MKKTNLFYWISTALFSLAIIFTAIPDIIVSPEALAFITNLGYPDYIIPFLGVAKALGAIAVLIPAFPKLKEWAYAGIFFDLLGATYSNIAKFGFHLPMLTMLVFFGLLFASYYLHHLRLKTTSSGLSSAMA